MGILYLLSVVDLLRHFFIQRKIKTGIELEVRPFIS